MAAVAAALCAAQGAAAEQQTTDIVVSTDAYTWHRDSVVQGPYRAWAESPSEIRSTYSARPGYFMPVEQVWKLRNDISAYPRLQTSQKLMQAVYNMGLDEMVNAVEPDTTLRTGKEWAGVWTRDVSYSIILSMASLQPEAAKTSLLRKITPEGQIVQDTGSGGAWPVSTDRLVWALAAWEVYKATGDKEWLRTVFPVVKASVLKDEATVISPDGLVMGETSFIDWREQSYPRWMQTADIARSEAMGTNFVHAAALGVLADMAAELGHKAEAAEFRKKGEALAEAADKRFWLEDKGYHAMYTYGRDNLILNPRAETLGDAIAVIYGLLPAERARSVVENIPVTPFGAAIFYPQIADMPNYHNNALWPFVASYWALANASQGSEQGTLEAIGSVIRPAALFATNKENFNLDNGDIYTELNSSNMLWSLAGNLALTQRILFGIGLEKEGIRFRPFVPEVMGETRVLENFPYRSGRISVTVNGFGSDVASLEVNGKRLDPHATVPARLLADGAEVVINMDNRPIAPVTVNHVANLKAPLTPQASLRHNDALGGGYLNELAWQPIEYIASYDVLRDGQVVASTRRTAWDASEPGEWQVVGVASDGTRSFASEPHSNRPFVAVQPAGEGRAISSGEVSYAPEHPVEGFHGEGFVESDMSTPPVSADVTVADEGRYSIAVRYANGNGPVNTENKCAVRALFVDGVKAGTVVLPQRGVANWDDWGLSDSVIVTLTPGDHVITLRYLPEDRNMNGATNHALVDEIILTRL